MKGLWIASRLTAPIPGEPAYGAGCEIGNTGRRLIVELFYNPSAALRFGSLNFGSEAFGQYTGAAPTTSTWQDVTQYAYGGLVTRGNLRPNINAPADAFTFDMYDPTADLIEWRPPGSLASPGLHTPCRVGIAAYNGTYLQI